MKILIHGKENTTESTDNKWGTFSEFLDKTYDIYRSRGLNEVSINIEEDQLVELTFEDGTTWYAQAGELPLLFGQLPSRAVDVVFDLPTELDLGNERGIFDKIGLRLLRLFSKNLRTAVAPIAERSAVKIAHGLEQKIMNKGGEGLYLVSSDFKLFSLDGQVHLLDLSRPVLLLIHGTAAHSPGSFGGLMKNGREWAIIRSIYKNNIIAFEHCSVTKSPVENVQLLLEKLPNPINLHLLSMSRGGLVGELFYLCLQSASFPDEAAKFFNKRNRPELAELFICPTWPSPNWPNLNGPCIKDLLAQKTVQLDKFVRVACPAQGTNLFSDRVDKVIGSIFNLAKFFTSSFGDLVIEGLKELTIAIAQERYDAAALPGLEAMVVGSPIPSLLNSYPQDVLPRGDLYVISGNSRRDSALNFLIWPIVRPIFRGDNDFVVDTNSMVLGARRLGRAFYRHIEGKKVQHLGYFEIEDVQTAIRSALSCAPGIRPDNFKEIKYGQRNRGTFGLPDGSLYPVDMAKIAGKKPIVVLIPGIMGSNLSENKKEVWINYATILGGGLDRLQMGKNVEASSVIRDAYGDLHDQLKDKGYEVVVFPYDWRLPVQTSGDALKAKIAALLSITDKPIHIVAHSMGGLLVRHLMTKHKAFWEKMKENNSRSRTILLGTPWGGSYLIPHVLTGHGRTICSLALLDLAHTKRELLSFFSKYPGLYDLLPREGHEFDNIALWEKVMLPTTDKEEWVLPSKTELKNAREYALEIEKANPDLSDVIYIAGRSDSTVSSFVLKNKYGHVIQAKPTDDILQEMDASKGYKLVYTATKRGDGSVTWDLGIPKQIKEKRLNLYYANTVHGELANDPKNFMALFELLEYGTTNRLQRNEPAVRSYGEFDLPSASYLPNDPDGLVRSILNMETSPLYEHSQEDEPLPISVTVTNGHLKYASHPLMVGHFQRDGIVNAEKVLNIEMDYALSKQERMGLYPGDIGTHLVMLTPHETMHGAIVVGLGSLENLTPFTLSKTVEQGCLAYMLSKHGQPSQPSEREMGISSLLVGSSYASLSLSSCLTAIINGINMANRKIKELGDQSPQITAIEFVEIYRDKAETAYYLLHQLSHEDHGMNFDLIGNIRQTEGHRTMMDLDEGQTWWTRITAIDRKDEKGRKGIYMSASTSKARVEERQVPINPKILKALLHENSGQTNWDTPLAKTLFELIIPNDFKIALRNQQNILWILDKTTASWPVELLHYDAKATVPIGATAGLIRQLATAYDRPVMTHVPTKRALVIGDPKLPEKLRTAQLPDAADEAVIVDQILKNNDYETIAILHGTASDVFKNLYHEYRIVHIAAHGVIDYGDDKETGILLSDGEENIILTTYEINQISSTPELVFVNCCYSGKVDPEKEAHFRERYRLAANIGMQFIENGVRAVVVAGWAVNDSAAKLFAEVFYKKMLSGAQFGEAVRAARKTCFEQFPGINTWGAYQCYGDPYYQLEHQPMKGNGNGSFILPKQAMIALEIWLNKANSNDFSTTDLKSDLEAISAKIKSSNLDDDGPILEMEAFCYAELGLVEQALNKLASLFSMEGAIYSSKSIELFYYLKGQLPDFVEVPRPGGRVVKDRPEKEAPPILYPDYQGLINDIKSQQLLSQGSIYELSCLLGITYRRKALDKYGSKDDVRLMAIQYENAFNHNKQKPVSDKWLALANCYTATCIGANDESELREKTGTLKRLLDAELRSIGPVKRSKESQTLLRLILLNECRIFTLREKSEHEKLIKKIKEWFEQALKYAVSRRAKLEKVEQFSLFKKFAATYAGPNKELFADSVEKLLNFYKEKL